MGNTSERIDLRNDGISWLKGSRGRVPSIPPKPGSLLQPHQGKGEVMDLGIPAPETTLETQTALCINALMGKELFSSSELSLSGSDKQKKSKEQLKCTRGRSVLLGSLCVLLDRVFLGVCSENGTLSFLSCHCRTGRAGTALSICKITG